MPSAVTIKRLKKVVGGKSILKSIDLAVRPGEFLTLVGPSGCGKSTLLRVISGLTEFTSGSVLIDPENRGIYTQSDSPKKSSRNIWSLAV
ncbi:ATP-binding cassette domain-containing protein, partial [Sutterella wadsworthensis]|uniref:ATP-binding cassette domain-containing protein n=2 Tax=Sutterella wadsworthensis TaxID=40545 RepID=UPI0032BFCEC0